MQADIAIRNGRVVTPAGTLFGGVAVKGEKIVYVGADEGLPEAARVLDARGAYVIPGLIEPHAHLGLSSSLGAKDFAKWRRDFESETEGAIHGGVTTVLSHWTGVESYLEHLPQLIEWGEEKSYIDFNFHPVIGLESHLAEIPELVRRGVTSFKHYNYLYYDPRGKSLGIFPCDDKMLFRSLEIITASGPPALAMVHAEDGPIIEHLAAKVRTSGRADLEAWTLARPPLVENIRIRRIIDIACHLGAPVYFVHVTTKEAAAMVAAARREGQAVWGETQTCFLTHTATAEAEIGAWGKINPALKYEADRQALWRGIRSGGVTCLGDDHLDYGLEDKQPGGASRFHNIWGCNAGMPGGMEHLLPVMITAGVRPGLVTMEEVVRVCSANTARAMGLYPRKGVLAPGADADIVVVNPDRSKTVDKRFYHTHVKDWSLYWGWTLYGIPSTTLVRGRVVVEDGETVVAPGHAKFVPGRSDA